MVNSPFPRILTPSLACFTIPASIRVITHIAFVQEKRAGYIYVSQHTTNLYDAMFNQRVSESDMQNKYHIILIDFT